jgi:hypothetical protein
MLFASINLFYQQVKSVVSFLILQFKYKKDFLIVETHSIKEASKVGEFSFKPGVFLFVVSFFGFLIVLLTVLVIQVTPLGYTLLSNQNHPKEEEFVQIAYRLKILSDSLQSFDSHIESFKAVLRNPDDIPLTTSGFGSQSSSELGMGIALIDSEISLIKPMIETNHSLEESNINLARTTEFGLMPYFGPDYFIDLPYSIPLKEFDPTEIKVINQKE